MRDIKLFRLMLNMFGVVFMLYMTATTFDASEAWAIACIGAWLTAVEGVTKH